MFSCLAYIRCSDSVHEISETSSQIAKGETKGKKDYLTECPLLIQICDFLVNPYPLMYSLNKHTRQVFKNQMPIQNFAKLRFNIPKHLEFKVDGDERELHRLLRLSPIENELHFFCALALDAFHNELYEENRDLIFKYIESKYYELRSDETVSFEATTSVAEYYDNEHIRRGNYGIFHEAFRIGLNLFYNTVYKYPELVYDIYKEIAQNHELLNSARNQLNSLEPNKAILILADLIIAGASKSFYFPILQAQPPGTLLALFSFIVQFSALEDETSIDYESVEEMFNWLRQNRADFNGNNFDIPRVQCKILFGEFEDELSFYENEIAPNYYDHFVLFSLAKNASMKSRTQLLWNLLNDAKNRLHELIYDPISTLEQFKHRRFLYKMDRFVAQVASVIPEAYNKILMTDHRFISSVLRNYSLNYVDITEDGDVRIVFAALEGRFEDGFPNCLEFLVKNRWEEVNWPAILLNVKESNSFALLSMWMQYLNLSSSTTCQCSSDMLRMLSQYDHVREFLKSRNVKLELSFENTMKLLKMPCKADKLHEILVPLTRDDRALILRSVKSRLELSNLEAITNDSIDRLFLNSFYLEENLDPFSFRPVVNYWINGSYKWSISEIQSEYFKFILSHEYPDEMKKILSQTE